MPCKQKLLNKDKTISTQRQPSQLGYFPCNYHASKQRQHSQLIFKTNVQNSSDKPRSMQTQRENKAPYKDSPSMHHSRLGKLSSSSLIYHAHSKKRKEEQRQQEKTPPVYTHGTQPQLYSLTLFIASKLKQPHHRTFGNLGQNPLHTLTV